MTTKLILTMMLVIISLSGCAQEQSGSNSAYDKINDSITSNWKNYSNNILGVSFRYPSTWTQYGKQSTSTNRQGEIMSIMISKIDTITHSIFSIEYHLPPYGAELYQIALAQFDTSSLSNQIIMVLGNKALETSIVKSSDVKGSVYNPPLREIYIKFLDKKGGEYFVRFETPLLTESSEVAKLNQVISSFQFIDKSKN